MAFPSNPSFGDIYYYPELKTTYKYIGEPTGWSRITTQAIRNYFPDNEHTHSDNQGKDLTYTNGKLTRIDFDNGDSKVLSYDVNGKLSTLVSDIGSTTTTKTFTYNAEGQLISIDIT